MAALSCRPGLVLLLASSCSAAAEQDAWSSTAAWLSANGAEVDGLLRDNATSHGGATVRGVVSKAGLGAGETLLDVPRKLWLTLDRFPELQLANLSQLPSCSALPAAQGKLVNAKSAYRGFTELKFGAAVAAEAKKGSASFFAPYLRTLPTLEDFRSFDPMFMGPDVVADFGALRIVPYALSVQASDNQTRACFEAWRRSPTGPKSLAGLEWGDVHLGLAWLRTRSYSVGKGEAALIPGSDMLNTARRSSLNTAWAPQKGSFALRTTAAVPAGAELYDTYCSKCDNEKMLTSWGVYLEDNPNALADGRLVDCEAWNFTPGKGTANTLRGATEAALELTPAALSEAKHWTAPRCRAATVAAPQGPMRCSLARLSWEYCSGRWGRGESETQAGPALGAIQTGGARQEQPRRRGLRRGPARH